MVDEYTKYLHCADSPDKVQIPLWSMNTKFEESINLKNICSDSSMVDEYM
mgnify:CR=1 FL=1